MNRGQVIYLAQGAPAKPPEGEPCNGCGVCCASEPCPLGMVLSRRRHGACSALRWDASAGRYLCGALAGRGPLLRALVRRWIGAGRGCDAALQAELRPALPRGR